MSAEFVLNDFPTEGIPVDAEKLGCFRLVSAGFVKSALDEFSFEFIHSFAEINTAFDHFGHERFQLLFHRFSLEWISYPTAAATSARARGTLQEISLSAHRA